jgi:hypothetical protein
MRRTIYFFVRQDNAVASIPAIISDVFMFGVEGNPLQGWFTGFPLIVGLKYNL